MLQLTQLTGFNARRAGALHKRGVGTAGIVLGSAGIGARHHVGAGAAGITIGAAGVGSTAIVHAGVGTATITLDAAGVGARHHVGAGSAAIVVGAESSGTVTGGMTITPVAYWKMDEASGTRADSVAANDLDEHGGTIGSDTGKIGLCPHVTTGTGDYLVAADDTVLRSSANFSVAGWFKASYISGGIQTLLHKSVGGYSNTEADWGVEIYANSIRFWIADELAAGTVFATADITGMENEWVFFAAVFDSDENLAISVNDGTPGTNIIGVARNTPDPHPELRVCGGARADDHCYMDEVGIFDFALSAGEITDLYNGGAGVTYNP